MFLKHSFEQPFTDVDIDFTDKKLRYALCYVQGGSMEIINERIRQDYSTPKEEIAGLIYAINENALKDL